MIILKASTFLKANNNPRSGALTIALILISILFLSVLSGILAAFGNLYLLLALLGLYGVFFILSAPVGWTVWIIFWAAFLITGPSAYFLRFTQFQWLTVLVSAALLLPVLSYLLRSKTKISSTTISSNLLWPGIFLLLLAFSTVITDPKFADFVNASRHYLLMWPIMLVFMFGLVRQEMVVQLWKALMLVAILQFPMAIYQYFFVALKSARSSPWDAVIGTFHGNMEGGGDSAAMAIMLLIAMLLAIALWRGGKLHGVWMALVIMSGLGVLALAEVKASVMLLPVVIGLYYRKELLQRPIEAIVVVVGAILLVGGLLFGYEKIHYENNPAAGMNQAVSTYDLIIRAIDPENETAQGLGRVAQLVMWWDVNVKSGDVHHSLFGYGMAATYASRFGVGELVERYSYPIDNTSTLVLLWETGILGHLAFLLILLSGAQTSGRSANNEAIPEIHRILLRVGETGLLLLAITLLYKQFHFSSVPIQFLMMLMLGQAAYWSNLVSNNLGRLDAKTKYMPYAKIP